ncbi:formimidoylglutamate deiminase [Marinihelvus fidelis]|uniref:Formimidoylglutamate deiminase n=1 Tax=Marinihelvus fidelis TaxID=2613842 RepID=A0A5N0T9Y9_9GAMM|nr:formimidoylglutamate deiminase [Marinihelvus fidelis]KAA9131264.1 formimidoylglutamate deiminase [Marinihelvus fidelis]
MKPGAVVCAHALLPDGWARDVRLTLDANGMIEQVETGLPAGGGRTDDVRLDGVVIPGMPNLHSHAFQRLMAGLSHAGQPGQQDSFWTWRETMYAMALRVSPGQLQACAAGLYVEMLKAGYTACAEFHYLHHAPDGQPYDDPAELGHRVLAAAQDSGIGLTLLPVFYRRSGFEAEEVNPRQRRFRNTVDGFTRMFDSLAGHTRGRPNTVLGLAPHSLRAASADDINAIVSLAPSGPVHIHIAEQRQEVEDCQRVLGARPIRWLLDQFDVDRRWCLVHATHGDAGELADAARSGAVAGLCPTTEADLGDGIFAAADWRAAGGALGIGSDSNLRICPAEELRLLEYTQRLVSGRRNVMAEAGASTGRWLWSRAAMGGAQALAQPVGQIAPGYRADLVELDREHPRLRDLEGDTVLDSYVFSGGQDMIASVSVAGERVVEQGVHRDESALLTAFNATLRQLRAST